MASTVPVLSREESNFLRVANLLIRLSPKAVRVLFDREFNPGRLKSIFSKNWTKLDKLKKKHVITQTQWSLLFPSGSDPKSNDFDLTLMVCLLRNLTKVTIQDHLPQPADISEGAALSRIKYYRNQIAHSDSGTMSEADFDNTFDAVSKAIEILCPTMKAECTSLQNASLDYSFHEIYVEFVKKEKQMEELYLQVKTLNLERNNLQSIQNEEISEWKNKLQTFYVTEAATRLIKVVKDNQCTIITGLPGSGKSALAYHVAFHMQETEGYTVEPVWLPSELIKMTNSSIEQFFVFDDVFGKYSLNEFHLNCWESETRRIKMLLKNKIIKVIVTCRSYLYDNVKDCLSFQSFERFNIQSDDISLSLEERKEIGKLYLTDDVISQLNEDVIMMYSFFPLLCAMFKENLMENVDFFENPTQFIKNEIENFKTRKDVSFIALAFLVLSNNSIEKECLQIGKDKYDSMLQALCDEMDTRTYPSKTAILSSLQNLKSMYLKETESIFCTKHDKIFDIISDTVGHYIIRCILRHGESTFISSRCQMKSLNEQHGDSTIMITDELETMYFERILKDIEREHNWEVFASIQMKFENFRILFMQYLEKSSANFSFSGTHCTTALHVTAAKGYFDMSKYLLEKNKKQIFSLDSEHRSPLHHASMNGHHEIAKLFLSYDAEIDLIDSEEYTPLLLSCCFGHSNVTEVLLKNHANVNVRENNYNWSSLHLAASDGNIDLIKLLVKHKAIVNSQMNNGMTPLYRACDSGHFNAVKLLIDCKADVNKCENEEWSPIHVASHAGFYDIAEILILNCADVNKGNNTGNTPLHYACGRNHIDIVQLLLQHGSSIDKGNKNGETPLHIICQDPEGCVEIEILKLLCEFGASTNKRSRLFYTPLHFFCNRNIIVEEAIITKKSVYEKDEIEEMKLIQVVENYTDVIKTLVKHGADVNMASNDGTTPIYLASLQNNLEAVKCLLSIDADANRFGDNGWSPLHIASFEGNEGIVNTLLQHGVSIDHCCKKGLTSLLLACSCGNTNIAEILIKNGAEMNKVKETEKLTSRSTGETMHQQSRTALYFAAEKGNIELIKILMENEADVNLQINNGMTPIYIACVNNHLEAVKMLLLYKADVNKCEENGENPLHVAMNANRQEIVAYLCENSSALVNLPDRKGESPLYLAVQSGNRNIAKLLINAGAEINKVNGTGYSTLLSTGKTMLTKKAKRLHKQGRTALYCAAENGNIDLIKILMENEADVNLQINNGTTPIYIACVNNHLEAVKMLLLYKADVNKCVETGWNPLHVASFANHQEIVAYLCENSSALVNLPDEKGESPLYLAVKRDNRNIAKLLINAGAEVNKVNGTGYSLLLLACERGNVHEGCNEIALEILQNGADVNDNDQNGRTSLHFAAEDGNVKFIKILIEHDADINIQMNNGMTPIYIACARNRLKAVKMLLSNKADINKCEVNGWSPLHVASYENHREIVEYLCEHGNSEINLSNKKGETPLQFACKKGNKDVVKLLLKYGASINHSDEIGFTSFHKACSKGNIEIVELLIKEDAAVNCLDKSDRTPLYIACEHRHRDVVELLLKQGVELNNAAQVYSKEGWTPLHVSASSGNMGITELLLQNKATVNVQDRNGHTPLYYATQYRHYDISELLVSQGTVLSNNDVQTPFLSRGPKRRKQCVIQ